MRKKYFFYLLLFLCGQNVFSQNLGLFAHMGSTADDKVYKIVPGTNGRVFLLGASNESIVYADSVNGEISITPPVGTFGDYNFITCIDSTGKQLWTQTMAVNAINVGGVRIASGPNNDVYAVAVTDGAFVCNGDSLVANNNLAHYLIHINEDGNIVLVKHILDVYDMGGAEEFKVDDMSNVYISGIYSNHIDVFGNAGLPDTTINPGQPSKYNFLMKLLSDGTFGYIKVFGNISSDFDVLSTNNIGVIVEINHGNNLVLDTVVIHPSNTISESYMVTIDKATGNYVNWTKLGNYSGNSVRYQAIQYYYNQYEVTGVFNDSLVFTAETLVPVLTQLQKDNLFAENFSVSLNASTLNIVDAGSFRSCSPAPAYQVTNPLNGVKYIAYSYLDTLAIDTTTGNNTASTNANIVIKAFDASYHHLWTKGLASSADDYVYGLTLDNLYNVYVLGLFRDTLQVLDSLNPYRNAEVAISKGGNDIIVGKIASSAVPTALTVSKTEPIVNMFPNPAENSIYIKGFEGNYELRDLSGMLVLQGYLEESNPIIILAGLASGTYILTGISQQTQKGINAKILKLK